jgi:hypothetical protein
MQYFVITCPFCQQKLRAPESAAGKQVKCPQCNQLFGLPATPYPASATPPESSSPPATSAVPPSPDLPPAATAFRQGPGANPPPAATPPPAQEQAAVASPFGEEIPEPGPSFLEPGAEEPGTEEYPRRDFYRQRLLAQADAWRQTRRGLGLVLSSILAQFIALVLFLGAIFILGIIVALQRPARGHNWGPDVPPDLALVFLGLLVLFGMAMLAAFVLYLVGNIVCLGAPAEHGARTLARASLVLLLAAIGVLIVVIGLLIAVNIPSRPAGARLNPGEAIASLQGLIFFAMILHFVHLIVFQFFLRALAQGLHRPGLVSSIHGLLLVGLLTGGLEGGMLILSLVTGSGIAPGAAPGRFQEARTILALGSCLLFVLGVIWFIWYLLALFQVRRAIQEEVGA